MKGEYFVYISRLEHPAKNHKRLIEAFTQFKEKTHAPHQLLFVGGDWHGAEEIREAGRLLLETGDLKITGFVDHADIPHLYRASEAMVMPSLYEGFGLPVVEAMACGTPVACSDNSALAEVGADAALLFDPMNVDEIAASLARLAQDGELRHSMRMHGLTHASGYTWDRCVKETIDVWKSVA